MEKTITTKFSSHSETKIHVTKGKLKNFGSCLKEAKITEQSRLFLASDQNVDASFVGDVVSSAQQAGFFVEQIPLNLGEENKTLDMANKLYLTLAKKRFERSDVVVSLGGGVCGDLVGFVAATWLRGVKFVSIPTTITAIVDSSIGGKTGINLAYGKNLVGAFKQPHLVFSDVMALEKLPKREWTSGWAEAIKHGLILDQKLTYKFKEFAKDISSRDYDAVVEMLAKSAQIKADVVSLDEKESGVGPRILLNYGHTTAHALESYSNYTTLLHGEAVALGMVVAGQISNKLGMLSTDSLSFQNELLSDYGLPNKVNFEVSTDAILDKIMHDKKVLNKKPRWVLLEGIGKAKVVDRVEKNLVVQALKKII